MRGIVFAALVVTACGDNAAPAPDAGAVCPSGTACNCTGGQCGYGCQNQCMLNCNSGASCDFGCGSTCTVSCGSSAPCSDDCGTGCHETCSGGASCLYHCESGCDYDCKNGSSCMINCGSNCHVTCEDTALCSMKCTGGGCTLNCNQAGQTCGAGSFACRAACPP